MIIETCPQESGTTTSGKHSSYPQTQPALLGLGYEEKRTSLTKTKMANYIIRKGKGVLREGAEKGKISNN